MWIMIWIFFCVIVGGLMHDKGRSFWEGFLISLLISPLIAGFLVLLLPSLPMERRLK